MIKPTQGHENIITKIKETLKTLSDLGSFDKSRYGKLGYQGACYDIVMEVEYFWLFISFRKYILAETVINCYDGV